MFANFGEIGVCTQVNSFTVQLNPNQIQSVQKFHRVLFEQLLQISHSFLEFDQSNSPGNYLVAPIKKSRGRKIKLFYWESDQLILVSTVGYQLDWVLISSIDFKAPDVNMEETLSGAEENLLGAVVNPCHRNSVCFDPANWVNPF